MFLRCGSRGGAFSCGLSLLAAFASLTIRTAVNITDGKTICRVVDKDSMKGLSYGPARVLI